jgi:hypothetical protein
MRRALLAARLCLALVAVTPVPAVAQAVGELQPGESARVAASPGSRVNVRSSPAITADNVVGQIDADAAVTVQGAERRGAYVWYRVTAAELTGWIRGDLLAPLDREPAPAQQTQPAMPEQATPPTASQPEPTATAAEDWTRYVPGLLRPVDACINSLSMQPVTVTRVFQVEPDMAGVRLRDPTGRRWECLISRNGNYPIRLDPLGDRVRPMPGDGDPIFTRAPGTPPSDPCWQNDEIASPTGAAIIGWRSRKVC